MNSLFINMQEITVFAVILCVWLSIMQVGAERDYDIFPERAENIKSDGENYVDFTYTKLVRRKREYFINGNFTFFQDMDNTFLAGLDSSYSPMGNNQFMRHPFRLPTVPICEYFNTTFRKYLSPMLLGKSNFPILPPEGLCPFPKGTYYLDDVEIHEESLPQHVPRGLWKAEEKFYKDNQLIGGFRFFAKVVDK